jgi:hypothetical protein
LNAGETVYGYVDLAVCHAWTFYWKMLRLQMNLVKAGSDVLVAYGEVVLPGKRSCFFLKGWGKLQSEVDVSN